MNNEGRGSYLYRKEGETNKEKKYLKESIKYTVFLIIKEDQIRKIKKFHFFNDLNPILLLVNL